MKPAIKEIEDSYNTVVLNIDDLRSLVEIISDNGELADFTINNYSLTEITEIDQFKDQKISYVYIQRKNPFVTFRFNKSHSDNVSYVSIRTLDRNGDGRKYYYQMKEILDGRKSKFRAIIRFIISSIPGIGTFVFFHNLLHKDSTSVQLLAIIALLTILSIPVVKKIIFYFGPKIDLYNNRSFVERNKDSIILSLLSFVLGLTSGILLMIIQAKIIPT